MVINTIIKTSFLRFVILLLTVMRMIVWSNINSRQVCPTLCSAFYLPHPTSRRLRATTNLILLLHRQQSSNRKNFGLAAKDGLDVDGHGRRIRRSSRSIGVDNNINSREDDGWENFMPNLDSEQPNIRQKQQRTENNDWEDGGWDGFVDTARRPQNNMNRDSNRGRTPRSAISSRQSNDGYRKKDYLPRNDNNRRISPAGRKYDDDYRQRSFPSSSRGGGVGGTSTAFKNKLPQRDNDRDSNYKINLMALETAGFVHLYGLSSVLNALEANKRDFKARDIMINNDDDITIKPEAQGTPWLFVQEKRTFSQRDKDKAQQAENVLELAKKHSIPYTTVDKGVLNTLSGNRPHQGYVLRCGKYEFEPLTIIPVQNDDDDNDKEKNNNSNLWLVLDEVVDPQNLGALIRSAYFLGCINMLVCAKNSAPPSATVSAASAGALELAMIYSTSNLPKTLAQAEQDGFRIIGASADGMENNDIPIHDLQNLPTKNQPTILVLGSEGRGLRHLVAKSCTEFVRIPSVRNAKKTSEDGAGGVDSLNVSVTGGILLWHLLQQQLL